jgi:preprotein translocase subunit SecG
MLYYTIVTMYVIVCLLLLVVVLLQQGKGGDIAAAFGGSSSQTAFGARAGATVLTRATTVLGALFMVGALALAIVTRTASGGSVVSGVHAPVAPAATKPAPPPLPMATSPAPAQPGAGSAPAGSGTTAPQPGKPPVKKGPGGL